MREWKLAHDIEHTGRAADESAGNGRAESEIAHLKHHTKLLLNTSRAPTSQYWPLALRHASEYRFRQTLERLGVPCAEAHPISHRGSGEVQVLASISAWFSYTYAEGQSVGTRCWDESFQQRILDRG